jgi:tRNA nucleotidyltransferase (CCA-adding enzyme)
MPAMKIQARKTISWSELPVQQRHLLKQICRLADERDLPIFLVGGVVRDLLLKRGNWDLDLTVEGDGIAFARLVADRYGAELTVFERFATARLTFPSGLKIDVATTREESYDQPAILPTVQHASIEEDLSRRDFTINAIAVRLNQRQFGRVLDPYEGRRDLRTRTIRVLHTGSFLDDPTRIFRAIRFEQRFGFRLERATARLLAQAVSKDLIQRLSGPRLRNEVLLLFAERDPVRVIARLEKLKLLRFLHRRLRYTKNVQQVVAAVPRALAWWARHFPDSVIDRPILYLMALSSGSSPLVVATMIRRLALSREQARNLSAGRLVDPVLKRLTHKGTVRPSQVYRLLADSTDESLVLLLAKQFGKQRSGRLNQLTRQVAAYVKNRTKRTALTGRDLQAMGLKPGPQYKTILEKLLDARLDGLITTKEDESVFVRKWLA